MTRPYPDTTGWGPFDPCNAADASCERERRAFTEFMIKRLRKQPKTGSDDTAILIGGMVSIVQVIFAGHAGHPPEEAREAMHKTFDFAWLQCAALLAEGETVQ
jgi:hypothetical protein